MHQWWCWRYWSATHHADVNEPVGEGGGHEGCGWIHSMAGCTMLHRGRFMQITNSCFGRFCLWVLAIIRCSLVPTKSCCGFQGVGSRRQHVCCPSLSISCTSSKWQLLLRMLIASHGHINDHKHQCMNRLPILAHCCHICHKVPSAGVAADLGHLEYPSKVPAAFGGCKPPRNASTYPKLGDIFVGGISA